LLSPNSQKNQNVKKQQRNVSDLDSKPFVSSRKKKRSEMPRNPLQPNASLRKKLSLRLLLHSNNRLLR
jgi:hypothetical protein